jgi:hypothetical protein
VLGFGFAERRRTPWQRRTAAPLQRNPAGLSGPGPHLIPWYILRLGMDRRLLRLNANRVERDGKGKLRNLASKTLFDKN